MEWTIPVITNWPWRPTNPHPGRGIRVGEQASGASPLTDRHTAAVPLAPEDAEHSAPEDAEISAPEDTYEGGR